MFNLNQSLSSLFFFAINAMPSSSSYVVKVKMSRSSPVWEFFEVSAADDSRANCKICKLSISRGKSSSTALGSKSYNTSNLRKHLEHTHKQQWEKILHDEKNRTSTSSPARPVLQGQMTLERTIEVKKPWEFDDARSRRIHKVIAEMIALDHQPFNIVNNEGSHEN